MEDTRMQSIPIDDILKRKTTPVDLYLRLKSDKFILISKEGSPTPVESLMKYKSRSMEVVFVKVDDYRRLISLTIRAASDLVASKNLSDPSRLAVIHEALSSVYQEISDLGFDEIAYNHAKLVNHTTLTFVLENPALCELLDKYGQLFKDGTKHSMMVSMVSTMLGMGHEWIKPATLEKLSVGGFLHDIGKTKIPLSILQKHINSMTRDERIIYESHCEVGKQALLHSKSVPDDVAAIVFEHHERSDGTGFPRELKDYQINPLARVVALANFFVERVYATDGPYSPATAKLVFDEIDISMSGKFNRDAIKVLRKLLFEKGMQAAG